MATNRALTARNRKQKAMTYESQKPMDIIYKVSVVFAIKEPLANIRDVIFGFLAQSYPIGEIVVIYSGDTDTENYQLLQRYGKRIKLIECKKSPKDMLSVGLENTTGQFVLYMNDPVILGNQAVEQAMQRMEEKKGGVYVFSERNADPEGEDDGKKVSEYSKEDMTRLVREKLFSIGNVAMLTSRKRIVETLNRLDLEGAYSIQGCIVYALSQNWTVFMHSETEAYGRSAEIESDDDLLDKAREEKRILCDLDIAQMLEKYVSTGMINAEAILDGFETRLRDLLRQNRVASYAFFCRLAAVKFRRGKQRVKLSECIANDLSIASEDVERLLNYTCRNTGFKRVAYYVNVWRYGGIERVGSLLFDEFKSDYQLLLITSCDDPTEKEKGFDIPREATHIRTINNKAISLHEQITILSLIAGIEVFIGNPNIMVDFLPIYQYMRPFPIKTIACNHYFYYLPYQFDWPWLQKVVSLREEALPYADACVWLTNFSAACAKKINPCTVRIANPNTFSEMPLHSAPQEKIVLVVGRFYDIVKRVDRAFEIFKCLLAKDPDAQLWLVGGFEENVVFPETNGRYIGEYVKNALQFPEGTVRYFGEQNDVKSFFQEASVLLMPSECEGYGMVLREAGVAGVPAIVSNYPGASDLVEHDRNGYLVNLNQRRYEEAAEYIHQLLNDKELWKRMSVETQRMAVETDIENVGNQWRMLVDSVTQCSGDELASKLRDNGLMPRGEKEKQAYAEAMRFMEEMLEAKMGIKSKEQLAAEQAQSVAASISAGSQTSDYWENLCHVMEGTFSWRITKSLRLATQYKRSIKAFGVIETNKKVFRRIKAKINKRA